MRISVLIVSLFSVLFFSSAADAAVLFDSNWSTETGTDWGSGIQDGGRWDEAFTCGSGNPYVVGTDVLEVIPGSRVGWSLTPNVLQVKEIGNQRCGAFQRRNVVPVSTSHYGRLYFRDDETLTMSYHNAAYNFVGNIQLVYWNRRPNATGSSLGFSADAQSGGFSYNYGGWYVQQQPTIDPFNPPLVRLPRGTWYRYEWHIEYLSATTYRLWPRLYDVQGNLLYDADDFMPLDNFYLQPSHTLASWYAQGGNFTMNDPQLARNIGLGNEGRFVGPRVPESWYYAGFAICDTWCGPLQGGAPVVDVTPPSVTILAPAASQVFTAGTTSVSLSVTTNEPATCRWSPSDVAYASMTNTLSGAGSTSHSATVTGLANGQSYTRFVRCQDTAGNVMASSVSRTFSVSSITSAICGNGVVEAGEACDTGASNGVCPSSCSLSCTVNVCGTGPTITVDSTYAAAGTSYDARFLNDAAVSIDIAGTWASAESSTLPHWVQFDFPTPVSVSQFTVYWLRLNGAFMGSQQLLVQRWDGSAWITLATVNNAGNVASSTVSFSSPSTSRYRLYQPPNQGNAAYPVILGLSEVDYVISSGGVRTGDLNGDGRVDAVDLAIMVNALSRNSVTAGADLNSDGAVNIFDVVLLTRNWG